MRANVCVRASVRVCCCWCVVPRRLPPPPAVDACSGDSIVSMSKDLPAALFLHVFIMLIQRKEEQGRREEGRGNDSSTNREKEGNLSPPSLRSVLVSSFSPPPLFPLSPSTFFSSRPRTLFICRFLIFPLTSLIIPPNIVFIITHNNDSHPCKRNVRCAWRIFHR